MGHTPHELTEEFPHDSAKIHSLRLENGHFGRLCGEYHALNRQIHRSETRVEPMDDLAENTLRKKRAALKDEIAAILARS